MLDNFASSLDASETKHIILVMDNASWHTSPKLVLPEGVETVYQPPYSPELQQHRGKPHPALVGLLSAEHLWSLSDELVTNRCLQNLDDLERRLSVQCERLMQNPERVKVHTLFHWWPGVC